MSEPSISVRLFRDAIAVALLALLAPLAYAHEAHEKKPPSVATLESPAADPAVGHEHPEVRVAPDAEEGPREPTTLLEWIGRLHPMVVHFPIAFFITALVAEIQFAATRRDLFRHSLRFLLWGGALSAIVAAALGWIFAATGQTDGGSLLVAHRWAGSAVAALGLAVLAINERVERSVGSRALLRLCLAAIALLTAATGFLGASLLYGIEHLAW